MLIFITVFDSFLKEELKLSMKNVTKFNKDNIEDFAIIYQINTGRLVREVFPTEVERDTKYAELLAYIF